MRPLKYLAFLILPFTVSISFVKSGWLTYLPVFSFFILVPLLELLFKPDSNNFNKEEEEIHKNNKIYTYVLYFTIPIQFFFLGWFLLFIVPQGMSFTDFLGKTISMGLMCGVIGINVGHELGHRNNRRDEFLGEILLLTSLNTHFLPYHNAGHHFNVATPKDAATARKNESLYTFWVRSHFQSYYQAWIIENKRLNDSNRPWYHYQNRMVAYTFSSLLVALLIFFLLGLKALCAFTGAAIVGILLLETVNYIEHYGLLRNKNERGRYERVKRAHSWNSNHIVGKYMLFNLSRHSDHHYNGSKHYQLLKSLSDSPQMPTGYPGMMLIALFPPVWFKLMNKKLNVLQEQ
ncbi:alkane 1-monooxygenase [Tenacibaculum sp. MAR_2009_124]|uniref:alkane 1-monooxygenase n=1 Tax=Tenacibaculum sp. MAR_2009_124 TaxID=1250059 RepID=UPI00089D7F4B|nr:alkane 1-monooxygenase [Tenacibaculum sp. MAR_2009_124]SEB66202.1 alkane 1-monooxygenase [Tenacibaculum sp. MAR_2009_124]